MYNRRYCVVYEKNKLLTVDISKKVALQNVSLEMKNTLSDTWHFHLEPTTKNVSIDPAPLIYLFAENISPAKKRALIDFIRVASARSHPQQIIISPAAKNATLIVHIKKGQVYTKNAAPDDHRDKAARGAAGVGNGGRKKMYITASGKSQSGDTHTVPFNARRRLTCGYNTRRAEFVCVGGGYGIVATTVGGVSGLTGEAAINSRAVDVAVGSVARSEWLVV
jgi:hypothetical protein